MKKIIEFLKKNYFFFLFVILEVIALSIFFRNNDYQNTSVINTSNYLSGKIYEIRNNITTYFNLKKANEQLREENLRLRNLLPENFKKIDHTFAFVNDTLKKQTYQYTKARIINNSTNRPNNFITLNVGGNNKIEKEMAVVSKDGVVGIIKDVSPNYSIAISLLHNDVIISCRHKKSNYFGSLTWEGDDYRQATLFDIPSHTNVSKGDTIVTSGFSAIFPKDLLVGTVSDFKREAGETFLIITVNLSVDFKKVTDVYIIKNTEKTERIQLEKKAIGNE